MYPYSWSSSSVSEYQISQNDNRNFTITISCTKRYTNFLLWCSIWIELCCSTHFVLDSSWENIFLLMTSLGTLKLYYFEIFCNLKAFPTLLVTTMSNKAKKSTTLYVYFMIKIDIISLSGLSGLYWKHSKSKNLNRTVFRPLENYSRYQEQKKIVQKPRSYSLQEEPNLSSSASINEKKKNLIIALEETLMPSLPLF